MKFSTTAAVLLSAFAVANAQEANSTILDLAAGNSDLSALATLVTSPGFEAVPELLKGAGPYTLFAPSNAALEAAGLNTSDKDAILNVLLYHVLPASVASTDLKPVQFPNTLLTNKTVVALEEGKGQVLKIVNNNGSVTINPNGSNATVVTADVKASNGVVHIIDKLLLPPKTPSETLVAGNFTALAGLLTKANLTETVDKLVGVTIFVPTNEAFERLGEKANNLTAKELTDILTFHVAKGVLYSSDIKDGASAPTVQGKDVKASVQGTNVTVNGAQVVVADILLSNGVAHVINAILTPGQDTPVNGTVGPAVPPKAPTSAAFITTPMIAFTAVVASALVAIVA